MAATRQEIEAYTLELIDLPIPGSENVAIYKRFFASMSDAEFDQWIDDLESGKRDLIFTSPNGADPSQRIDINRNLSIAKNYGIELFQRIWLVDDSGLEYLTPFKCLILDWPWRRQAQLLVEKISIPEHNNSVDDLTGQPTGDSKGSKISYPEATYLAAMGLTQTLTEFQKYRGGDQKGFEMMNKSIQRTGGVSMNAIAPYASGVISTITLDSILKAMHLASTLR